MDTNEHQDGMIAKYIASKGMPETIEITCKRLARFCASKLPPEVLSELSKEEMVDLSRKGYFRSLRLKARDDLRNAIISKIVTVNGKTYNAKRVEESWPEYRIALELKELDENGSHP
jgi:hypothetical protein